MSLVRRGPAAEESKEQLDREFSELYRTHVRDVYSFAYYRIGNHHDAEDLTEQTFLQAYRHFARARRESNGRPLRPWLVRIAHNLSANYHRDRSRRAESALDLVEPPAAPHQTEQIVEDREELRLVLECLEEIAPERREALIMRFAIGMSNREIGRALGKSEGAAKVLVHRSLKQLEAMMKSDLPSAWQSPSRGRGNDAE